jgi:hypothetical protein
LRRFGKSAVPRRSGKKKSARSLQSIELRFNRVENDGDALIFVNADGGRSTNKQARIPLRFFAHDQVVKVQDFNASV